MKEDKQIIEKIIDWSRSIPEIKAIILEGSMGGGDIKDQYSDYDINLFVEDTKPFLKSDKWFEQFDEIVVFQKEGTYYNDVFIATRLVIYQNSRRVDFSFWSVSILEDWIENNELPEFYKNGYKILLDKIGIAENLPKPTFYGYIQTKPSHDKFLQTIYNFYFEASIIAKYLYRNNLWFACKLANGPIKDFLQQMIMWQTAEQENWNVKGVNSLGKNLEEKISDEVIAKLIKCFSVYDLDSGWNSLFAMLDLFSEISQKLSLKMGINYPEKNINKIINYINNIKRKC